MGFLEQLLTTGFGAPQAVRQSAVAALTPLKSRLDSRADVWVGTFRLNASFWVGMVSPSAHKSKEDEAGYSGWVGSHHGIPKFCDGPPSKQTFGVPVPSNYSFRNKHVRHILNYRKEPQTCDHTVWGRKKHMFKNNHLFHRFEEHTLHSIHLIAQG